MAGLLGDRGYKDNQANGLLAHSPRATLKTIRGLLSGGGLPDDKEAQFQRDLHFAPGWRDWRRDFMRDVGMAPNTDLGGDYNYRLAWATRADPQYHEPSDSYHGMSRTEMPPPYAPADLKAQDHPTMWKQQFMELFGFDPDAAEPGDWTQEAVDFLMANFEKSEVADDGFAG